MEQVAVAKTNGCKRKHDIYTTNHLKSSSSENNDDNSSELYYTEEESDDDDPTGFGLYGKITTAQLREALEESIPATESLDTTTTELERLLYKHYEDHIVYLESTETIETSGFPYIIMFHSFKKYASQLCHYTDMLFQSAIHYGGDICFAVTDFENYEAVLHYRPGNEAYWKRYKKLGFNKHRWPDVYAVDTDHRIYQLVGPLNEVTLKQFSLKLMNGELFKSEPLPEDDEDGFVRVCVAENFEQLVLKSDIDILLVLYGEKCPCSFALMPILEEVGNLLQDEDIIIVKMNAEANYLPLQYYAWYYPTIYYIRRNNKTNLVEYCGCTRTVQDIITFIARHSTDDLLDFNRHGKPRYD
ncbi:uncharacterized protein [Eurosta solidaginis]|uniref:uncharacterized protein n=1 Tax=Eurosta solidaginis TaxID=178769 RepID=UPI0035315D7A